MSAHSILRAVAACAPGKRVVVSVPSGVVYELPIVPEPPRPAPPDPFDVLSKQLRERDAASLALMESTRKTFEEIFEVVEAGQDEVVQSVKEGTKEIVGTLHLPVVPTKYDKDGRIIEARRKERS